MSRRKLNKIIWYLSGLRFAGGGERLLLEGLERGPAGNTSLAAAIAIGDYTEAGTQIRLSPFK